MDRCAIAGTNAGGRVIPIPLWAARVALFGRCRLEAVPHFSLDSRVRVVS